VQACSLGIQAHSIEQHGLADAPQADQQEALGGTA
jgi:hypothetical protein